MVIRRQHAKVDAIRLYRFATVTTKAPPGATVHTSSARQSNDFAKTLAAQSGRQGHSPRCGFRRSHRSHGVADSYENAIGIESGDFDDDLAAVKLRHHHIEYLTDLRRTPRPARGIRRSRSGAFVFFSGRRRVKRGSRICAALSGRNLGRW